MKNKKIKNKRYYSFIILFIIISIIVIISIILNIFTNNSSNKIINTPINEKYNFIDNNNYKEIPNISLTNNNLYDTYYKDYNENNYTYDNPKVVVNPFKNNPLSALIMFKTINVESVKITIKGKSNDDIISLYKEDINHIIPLYYLYPGENTIIISTNEGEYSLTINTESLDYTSDIINNNLYLTHDDNNIYAFDPNNNLRIDLNNYNSYVILSNNHLLVKDSNYSNILYEIDLLGYIYKIYELNYNIKNNIYLINNNLVVCDTNNNILTLNLDNLTTISSINIKDILFSIDSNYINKLDNNMFDITDYSYDYSSNNLVILLGNMLSTIYVSYDTNELIYIYKNMNNRSINNFSYKFRKYITKDTSYNYNFNHIDNINTINNTYFESSKIDNITLINNKYNFRYDEDPSIYKNALIKDNINIKYIEDKLYIDNIYDYKYIILLTKRGYSYYYDINSIINIKDIPNDTYYIYVSDGSNIFNTTYFITK